MRIVVLLVPLLAGCNALFGIQSATLLACDADACDVNATCGDDGAGHLTCTCKDGFSGDGQTCADVDECAADPGLCGPGAERTCANTSGGHECVCSEGYLADGDACRPQFVELAATCGIPADGSLWCWGSSTGDGTSELRTWPVQVGSDRDWASLGGRCATKRDGRASCWGSNSSGQVGDGSFERRLSPSEIPHRWRQTMTGGNRSVGIRDDGTLWHWGFRPPLARSADPVQLGADADWIQAAVGFWHACGLREGGKVFCWGMNDHGGLGVAPETAASASTPVAAGDPTWSWKQVSTGVLHTCAIRDDGTLWCWGAISDWLGDEPGMHVFGPTPQQVGGDADWISLASSFGLTCGLRGADRRLVCFGRDDGGGIVDPADPTLLVTLPGDGWRTFAVGLRHACAIDAAGSRWCVGHRSGAVFGDGQEGYVRAPTRVGTAADWSDVYAGQHSTCARKQNGELFCWGRNTLGRLGVASPALITEPTSILTSTAAFAAGQEFGNNACASSGGYLHCWGSLPSLWGDGSTSGEPRVTPTQTAATPGWSSVAMGTWHACAIQSGSLYCWGDGSSGAIGLPDPEPLYPTITKIGDGTWSAVVAGAAHTCAIAADGSLSCWGAYGATASSETPTSFGGDWSQVSAGAVATCGIAGGELHCWGMNQSGELGVGDGDGRNLPARVGTSVGWRDVSVGMFHACGIDDRDLYCWGDDADGKVGSGSRGSLLSPVRVGNESSWTAVSAGSAHTCGVKIDRSLWCWGQDAHGALGLGRPTHALTPVRVDP